MSCVREWLVLDRASEAPAVCCVDKLKSTFKCNGYTLGSRWGQRKAVTIWESEVSVFRC